MKRRLRISDGNGLRNKAEAEAELAGLDALAGLVALVKGPLGLKDEIRTRLDVLA